MNILEWFLKDYVTLKTGVKADENSDLHHWNKLHEKKALQIFWTTVCVCV